jgi:hypothetical protein
MASSLMLRRVALVRTDVSEELSASYIRVTIGEVGILAVTSIPSSPILVTLMKEVLSSSETSVLTRDTWRNIPEDAILQRTQSRLTCCQANMKPTTSRLRVLEIHRRVSSFDASIIWRKEGEGLISPCA